MSSTNPNKPICDDEIHVILTPSIEKLDRLESYETLNVFLDTIDKTYGIDLEEFIFNFKEFSSRDATAEQIYKSILKAERNIQNRFPEFSADDAMEIFEDVYLTEIEKITKKNTQVFLDIINDLKSKLRLFDVIFDIDTAIGESSIYYIQPRYGYPPEASDNELIAILMCELLDIAYVSNDKDEIIEAYIELAIADGWDLENNKEDMKEALEFAEDSYKSAVTAVESSTNYFLKSRLYQSGISKLW